MRRGSRRPARSSGSCAGASGAASRMPPSKMKISRNGLPMMNDQRDERAEARRTTSRRHRRHRAAAVERDDGNQVDAGSGRSRRRRARAAGRCPSASPIARQAAAPSVPRIGPARPTRASASALSPSDLEKMAAPRNGMNIGALALIPSRRSWITWPISCTNSSTHEARRELPAPEQAVGGDRDERRARGREELDLRQQQDAAPLIAAQNLATSAPIAASMLPMRLRSDCTRERRWAPKGSLRRSRVVAVRRCRGRGLEDGIGTPRATGRTWPTGVSEGADAVGAGRERSASRPLSMRSLWQPR